MTNRKFQATECIKRFVRVRFYNERRLILQSTWCIITDFDRIRLDMETVNSSVLQTWDVCSIWAITKVWESSSIIFACASSLILVWCSCSVGLADKRFWFLVREYCFVISSSNKSQNNNFTYFLAKSICEWTVWIKRRYIVNERYISAVVNPSFWEAQP